MNTFLSNSLLLGAALMLPATPSFAQDHESRTAKSVESSATVEGKSAKGVKHQSDAINAKPGKSITIDTSKTQSEGTTQAAKSNHEVWFDDIKIDLYDDPNHNGFYNRIVVDFDADTIYDHIDVYAVMSLTDPNGYTTDYYVTDHFGLYGESYSDDRKIDTVLTSNWPADGYDLSIHVYDSYNGNLLAYIDKYQAPALAYLPLESLDYEYSAPQYLSAFSTDLYLKRDDDGDGYYHEFSLELDVDVNYGSKNIYAEIYISPDNYAWTALHVSQNFTVTENDLGDKKSWNFDLLTGYQPGLYYIKMVLVDPQTQLTLLELHPNDYSALYAVPLEDAGHETDEHNTTSAATTASPRSTASKRLRHRRIWWQHGLGTFGIGFTRRRQTHQRLNDAKLDR